ncbi:hypothetical protein, partial [Photobacterium phosphoreum]|uniref:capsular polysaccharide export protein, LipB/KpsS family n=1 Tax=Photobacterium phosphoreum TaxID=659 RepID=UPI00195FAD29
KSTLLASSAASDVYKRQVYHSPNFSNHFDIVKNVYESLPPKTTLKIREHPLYKGKYEKKLYSFCNDNDIYVNSDEKLNDALSSCDVVIVNNSTVGLESIAQGKTTVVLGNCYYDLSNICLKVNNKKQLPEILCCSLDYKIDPMALSSFSYEFYNNYLYNGHFRDEDINDLAVKIIDKITCS